MVLVCHVILQDHIIKESCVAQPPMKNQHTGKVGSGNCGSGDLIVLVVEEQDSICPWLNLPLLFISKAHEIQCSHTKFHDIHTIIYQCIQ